MATLNNIPTVDLTVTQPQTGSLLGGMDSAQASTLKTAGAWTAMFGAIGSAVGSYYQAKTMQYQLNAQSSALKYQTASQGATLKFQQEVSGLNARQAEFQAQRILEAGERAVGISTMRYGKAKGQARASMAARGIQLGVGSAAEIEATTDLMKEIDSLTISANAVRAAEAARTQSVNYQTQSLLQGTQAETLGLTQGVTAENLARSAGTISPFSAVSTSLLGSASSIATTLYRDKILERALAASKT